MSLAMDPKTRELIDRLDQAVALADDCTRCNAVKDILHDIVESGGDFVPSDLLKPAAGHYARRLLHKDPAGRYSVLVMVWGTGQGTPLHDHAGVWCVECVYRGRIQVVSYSLTGKPESEGDLYHFERESEITAGIGDAGALIPPFEYHTICNAEDRPSATIHVYGGELTWCHAFMPEDGGYRKVRKELCYSE